MLSKVERWVVIHVGLAFVLNVSSKALPLVCLPFDFSSIPFGISFAGGGGRVASWRVCGIVGVNLFLGRCVSSVCAFLSGLGFMSSVGVVDSCHKRALRRRATSAYSSDVCVFALMSAQTMYRAGSS